MARYTGPRLKLFERIGKLRGFTRKTIPSCFRGKAHSR
jgi:hypothetical protein